MNPRSRELVSVLFADLASSTLVRSELGQDRADVLETALMTSMHEIVANSGGTIVRSTGDGLVATFPAVAACLDASVSLQQTVERMVRSGRIADLSLRVGVAVGDVSSGEFGPIGLPMAQAARLEQHARPGSILCVEEIRHLLGTSTDHVLEPLGALDLKGLLQPVSVAEARWSPLPAALPLQTEIMGFEASLPLAGRDADLRQLGALVERSVRERSTFTALVQGESGVGKTRLLYELSLLPEVSEVSVLYAACRVQRHRAFGPIRDILQVVIDSADPQLLRHWAARDSSLGVELPALATRVKEIGEPVRASGEETRYRSIAALSRFVGEILRDQPLVLLLDDVQWIDNSSVEVLEAILERENSSLVVVCGSRVEADALDQRLVRALRRRPEDHLSLALDPLARHDVADIISQVLPSADEWIAERLWERSAGSPFAVSDIVERPGWTDADAGSTEPSFVEALETMGGGARRFVEAAAVLGSDADPWLAGEAAELSEDDMIAAAEAAEDAGLMRVNMVHGTLSLAFRHDLVADEVRRLISVDERCALHSRAAEVLAERSGDLDASALARIATHLDRAGPLVDRDVCARAYLAAAEAAFAIGEFREVVNLADCGLALITEGDPLLRAELLLNKARSHGLLLDTSRALEAGIEVAAIARRLGANRLLARVAATQIRHVRGDPLEAEWNEVFTLAVESFDDTVEMSLRSLVLSNGVWFLQRGNDLDAVTSDAVRYADADGSAEAQVEAVYQRFLASAGSPYLEEQRLLLERLRQIWEPFGWGCTYAAVLLVQAAHALARGDRTAFDRVIAETGRHIERAPVPWDRSWYQRLETVGALAEGRWADADRQLNEPSRSVPIEFEVTLGQISWSMVEQGNGHLIVDELAKAGSAGAGPYFRAGLALVLADLGRTEEAHEIVRQIMPYKVENHHVGVHTAAGVLGPIAMVVDVVQDAEIAASLLPEIEPWEGQIFWIADVLIFGAADRFLGMLTACLGDESRSRQLFSRALVLEERFGIPPHVARTSFAYARSLSRWGDLAGARHHRDRAAKIAEELGMSRLVVDCAELL